MKIIFNLLTMKKINRADAQISFKLNIFGSKNGIWRTKHTLILFNIFQFIALAFILSGLRRY